MDLADLNNRFTYHPPIQGLNQSDRYQKIRDKALETASYINSMTPESREQSLAITKLEEMVYWANAAIARNEKVA